MNPVPTLCLAGLLLATQALDAQSASTFNRGCGPVATWPRLRVTKGTPKIGTQIQITGSLLSPGRPALTAVGISNQKWGSINLPLMIDPTVGPPCQLLVSPDVILFGQSDKFGQQSLIFMIPNDRKLIGRTRYLQMANTSATGLAHWTDGLALKFG
ncbi:MAG: hypothetical protein V3U11_03690 [Planctomycetota bacterium]